ncbi:MAG TPA: energy transducer TonB [Flavilitoribacter sp.]|nr:energy transducer TonB [Flavilitoribacter sp.]
MITLVIDVTGRGILLAAGGVTIGLIALVHLIRANGSARFGQKKLFNWSGSFFNLGLLIAVGLAVMALGWTQYDKRQTGYFLDLTPEEDVLVTPPPTSFPKPPPPVLPPPVIEAVPEEELLDEEPVKFENMNIDEDTPVDRPEPVFEKPRMPALPPPVKNDAGPPEIFSVVEEMPRFPGCDDLPNKAERQACSDKALLKFMYDNLKYPSIARENGMEGTAVIRFVVETDGSISGASIVRNPGGGLGEEALRVVNLFTWDDILWTPGKQGGRKVRVQFNLPVKFKLEK